MLSNGFDVGFHQCVVRITAPDDVLDSSPIKKSHQTHQIHRPDALRYRQVLLLGDTQIRSMDHPQEDQPGNLARINLGEYHPRREVPLLESAQIPPLESTQILSMDHPQEYWPANLAHFNVGEYYTRREVHLLDRTQVLPIPPPQILHHRVPVGRIWRTSVVDYQGRRTVALGGRHQTNPRVC